MLQTLDQQRARYAWDRVPGAPSAEFVSLAESAPATILMTGLGQTVAFSLSKRAKEQAHADFLATLAGWLLREAPPAERTPEHLVEDLVRNDSTHYRRRTTEALAFLVWLKRFAKARA